MMVQTVTGPIPVERLGRTLMHEHLFIAFAGAEFDPTAVFDRAAFIAEAVRRLVQLRTEHGVRSFVDPCPIELGRDVTVMKEISEKSGMHIICTTGFYLIGLKYALLLGIVALFHPLSVPSTVLDVDVPVLLTVTALFALTVRRNLIGRGYGAALLVVYGLYLLARLV